MSNPIIYLVFNVENRNDEDEPVAVFVSAALARAFTERHPRFYGRYRVEEKELNPHFEQTDKWVYLVIIDPQEDQPQVFSLDAFDAEQQISQKPVSKDDGRFYMYLFADDKSDAVDQAKAKFIEMVENGQWLLLADDADEED